MAKSKKTINVKEFYSNNLDEYLDALKNANPDAGKTYIIKSNVSADAAVNAVEEIIRGKTADSKKYNKNLLQLTAKKGGKPIVKKVYQNVMATFFKTSKAEYDYSYSYNGDTINMSPVIIAINEGHAEFSVFNQCYAGENSYPWDRISDDKLVKDVEPGYVIANLGKKDFEKDSKASMKQYNKKLKDWLEEFQQEKLGKARTLYNVHVYDKEYDYDELILLAPYILVSYDLGSSIVTFSVNAITGSVESVLLNNPAARFETNENALPPSFSIPLFILASLAMVVVGGLLYLMWYFNKKLTYNSKSLNGYAIADLKKLL